MCWDTFSAVKQISYVFKEYIGSFFNNLGMHGLFSPIFEFWFPEAESLCSPQPTALTAVKKDQRHHPLPPPGPT